MADGHPVVVDAGSGENASGAAAEESGCSTDDTKTDLEAENEAYLRDKPEVMALIRLFMTTVLEQRPADPRTFAAEFFGRGDVLERARERGSGSGAAAAASARPRERSSSHAERDASAAAAEAPAREEAGARGSRARSAPGAAAAASANESTSGDGLPCLREDERDGARQCRKPPEPSSPT